MNYEVLPAALAASAAFKADVDALTKVDPQRMSILRTAVGRERDIDEQTVEKIQQEIGVRREAATKLAFTMNFLALRLTAAEAEPSKLVAEIEHLLQRELTQDVRDAISNTIAPTPEDVAYETSSTAFAFGETYLGSSFFPIFTFGAGARASSLFAGFSWTLAYRDGAESRKSLSINISTAEIRELAGRMLKSADEADAKLKEIQGTVR